MTECKVCFAQRMSITSVSVIVNELCDSHYRNWVDEEVMGVYEYA
jgi:hypothetical protein